MANVKADIEELKRINTEINRNMEIVRKLRKRKSEIESRVTDYLNEKDIPGVKHNGDIITVEKKEKTITKSKKGKDAKIMELLENSGVKDAKEIIEKIKYIGKEKITTQTLKINNKRT
jgi:hypothetical protein